MTAGELTTVQSLDGDANESPTSAAAIIAPNPFSDVDNFDSRLNGSVRNQGNWQTNQPGSTDGAIVTSTPPNEFSGKALMNDPNGIQFRGNAYNPLGSSAIANNTIGTFFIQIYNDSLIGSNLSIGLSDVSAPGLGSDNTGTPVSFGDYEIQVTFANGELRVRDGNRTRKVSNITLRDDTLYNFWMVADTGSDTYNVYVQGGNISNQTQLAVNGKTDFGFRNGSASSDLTTYLQLNGTANPPTAKSYIDSLAIDPNNDNLANPAPSFSAVETFEAISAGSINGRRGWSTSSNSASVVSDPVSSNNKVLRVTGSNVYARKSTPNIGDGTDGTLFFRLRRSGSLNSSAGLSDRPQATTWSDFENQIGFQNSSQLKIRDGGAFDVTGTIAPNLWHGVWLVTDNATDTYEVYARGGSFNTVTQLVSGSQTTFNYRNGTNGALSDFLVRTGSNNGGTLLIDDIYLDSSGTNLSLPGSNGIEFSQTNTAPLSDPIPETIEPSGLSVTLNEIAQIPASQTNKPLARINYLTHANDNSDRLFVNDLNDKLYVINNGTVSTYLNVKARFPDFVDSPRLGTGFGFFAFAPDFAQSGKFYTVHTEAGNALSKQTDYSPKTSTSVHGIITEWTARNPAANTFSGTKRELLRVGFETFLHGFQQIGFNPTATPGSPDYGLLYLAVGDGEQNPLFSNGPQDLSVPHGKILRIDPDGSNSPNRKYGIPNNNPFVSQNSALDEIWAYGLRNPHRFSWDSEGSNQMFIGNIGEKNIESIYPGIAGANYGWNIREGAFRFEKDDPNNVFSLPANDDQFGITYPVAQWDHDEGLAVVGGFVYRGDHIPQLSGKYIFGDIVRGRIFYADVDDMVSGSPPAPIEELLLKDVAGNQQTLLDLVNSRRVDLRFGIDADNGIYILSKQTGQIWKLEDNSGGPLPGAGDVLLFSLKNRATVESH
ncbi:MAG: PQQ-dependent sugar dehydrogenase [Synechococcus sp.]